jgi:drug/metabolite transporter (DMT)-like permease
MLAAALTFAIYSILLKRKPKELSVSAMQLSTFLLGLIFLLPFFLWESVMTPDIRWSATIIGSILYVGIFASLTAFILWNKAIIAIGPTKAGMVYYTLPLFGGVLAYIFLQESISSLHFTQGEFVPTHNSSHIVDLIFVLVKHPRIEYKETSFILGESGIEFKSNPSSTRCVS